MKNKILFRLVRLPIPWKLRIVISKFLSLIKFSKDKRIIKSTNNNVNLIYDNLKHNGYFIYENFLSLDNIKSIKEKLKKLRLNNPWKNNKFDFYWNSPPKNTHVGYYSKSEIIDINEINDLMYHPLICSVVSKYLGKNFQCTNVASWWTFGNNNSAEEAEFFHRDLDNISWLKVFIYLTDTDISSGAHAFVPGSHRVNKLLTFGRYNDEQIKEKIGPFIFVEGKKGTMIIEDTFGFHKGQHIKEDKNRLILQFQYSILSNPY
jgi:hypothetical protein